MWAVYSSVQVNTAQDNGVLALVGYYATLQLACDAAVADQGAHPTKARYVIYLV